MLRSLHVKDYALIENITVEFDKGLNIITGETGSGKSILIDALGLLLGERASTEAVRKGAGKSVVEGIFNVEGNKKVEALLTENEIEYYPELILRREISLKGANRIFINDTPAPLNLVKEAGNLLIDLHGQHEHQSLLRTETHIDFLDDFAGTAPLLAEYQKHFKDLNNLIKEFKELIEKESSIKEKKEIYTYQIKEIDAVAPVEKEDEQLESELNILENSERLLELTNSVYQNLYESENSVSDLFGKIKNELEELCSIDNSFAEVKEEGEQTLSLINDISRFISDYKSRLDIDPQKLNGIRERLNSLSLLKKKFGGSIEAILTYREMIGKEFDLVENFQECILEHKKKIDFAKEYCGHSAKKLSDKRKKASANLERDVKEILSYLGIPDSIFKVNIENRIFDSPESIFYNGNLYQADYTGFDKVEFFITANLGEDSKPLAKVASGGEISRIMLALKSILAKSDKLPLLVFDEIDTGVSGRIAQKVGSSLKSLAEFHQIIAITHLPQIAGLADQHFVVEKKNRDGRVVSSIKKLNDDERVIEVAKLMSGESVTDASLNGAKELIGLKKQA